MVATFRELTQTYRGADMVALERKRLENRHLSAQTAELQGKSIARGLMSLQAGMGKEISPLQERQLALIDPQASNSFQNIARTQDAQERTILMRDQEDRVAAITKAEEARKALLHENKQVAGQAMAFGQTALSIPKDDPEAYMEFGQSLVDSEIPALSNIGRQMLAGGKFDQKLLYRVPVAASGVMTQAGHNDSELYTVMTRQRILFGRERSESPEGRREAWQAVSGGNKGNPASVLNAQIRQQKYQRKVEQERAAEKRRDTWYESDEAKDLASGVPLTIAQQSRISAKAAQTNSPVIMNNVGERLRLGALIQKERADLEGREATTGHTLAKTEGQELTNVYSEATLENRISLSGEALRTAQLQYKHLGFEVKTQKQMFEVERRAKEASTRLNDARATNIALTQDQVDKDYHLSLVHEGTKAADAFAAANKGTGLSAENAMMFGAASATLESLHDFYKIFQEAEWLGSAVSKHFWATKSHTLEPIKAFMAHAIGDLYNTGVMTQHDYEHFLGLFPSSDEAAWTARIKMHVLIRSFEQKVMGQLDALGTQGFNVRGMYSLFGKEVAKNAPPPFEMKKWNAYKKSRSITLREQYGGQRTRNEHNRLVPKYKNTDEIENAIAGQLGIELEMIQDAIIPVRTPEATAERRRHLGLPGGGG